VIARLHSVDHAPRVKVVKRLVVKKCLQGKTRPGRNLLAGEVGGGSVSQTKGDEKHHQTLWGKNLPRKEKKKKKKKKKKKRVC